MAVKFGTVEFLVRQDSDGYLPTPEEDETGMTTYTASILVEDRGDFNTLKGYKSIVTPLPAQGAGGIVVVSAGVGKKTLIYPMAGGDTDTNSAILTNITGLARSQGDDHWQCDCTWILVL